MKKILLTSLALIFSIMIFAQQSGPTISWVETTHDFGQIKEDGGEKTWSFEFVNTGNEPLMLQNVKPSCGCTAVDYTKTPVEPGQKGYVKASYNPKNRGFGKFNKSITVTTNESQPVSYLRIVGEAINPNAGTETTKTINTSANPVNVSPDKKMEATPSNRNIQTGNVQTGNKVNSTQLANPQK